MIDRDSCGYVPRNEYTKKGKKNERARRIEWSMLSLLKISVVNSVVGETVHLSVLIQKAKNSKVVNAARR